MPAKPHAGFRTHLGRRLCPDGKVRNRPCLLFRVYNNMRGRAHGNNTKSPWCYVQGWPWESYAEWRAWALRSGFSKATPSPDREHTDQPYGPGNVVWRTVRDNCAGAAGRAWTAGAQPSGPEPPYDDYVPF